MSRRKSGGLTPGGAAEGDTLPTVVTIPHIDMIDELEEELARVAAEAVQSFGAASSSTAAGGGKQRELLERLLAGLRVSAFAAIQRHCVAVGGEGEPVAGGGRSGSAGASAAASDDPFAHPAELGTERPGILQEEESMLTEPVDHDLAKRVVALEREAAALARDVKAARGQGAASILAGVQGAYETRLTRAAKAAAPVLEAEGRALAEMGVSLPASRPGSSALAAGAGAGGGAAAGAAAGKWGIGPSQRRQSRGAAAAASVAGTSSSSASLAAAGAAGPGAGAGSGAGPVTAAAALEDLIAGTGSAAAYLTRLAAGSRGGGKAGGRAGSKAAGAGAGAASSRAFSGSSAAMDVDDEEAAAIAAAATAAASLTAEEAAEAEQDAEAAAARDAGFAVTAEVLPEVAASYRDQRTRLRAALKTATDTQGVLERLKQKGPATAAFDGVLAATS